MSESTAELGIHPWKIICGRPYLGYRPRRVQYPVA